MVAGSSVIKGLFYAVLNYTDAHRLAKQSGSQQGLRSKATKKRAEAFLQEQRRSFQEDMPITGDVLCRLHGAMAYGNKEFRGGDNFRLYSNMVKKVSCRISENGRLHCRSCRQNTSRIFT